MHMSGQSGQGAVAAHRQQQMAGHPRLTMIGKCPMSRLSISASLLLYNSSGQQAPTGTRLHPHPGAPSQAGSPPLGLIFSASMPRACSGRGGAAAVCIARQWVGLRKRPLAPPPRPGTPSHWHLHAVGKLAGKRLVDLHGGGRRQRVRELDGCMVGCMGWRLCCLPAQLPLRRRRRHHACLPTLHSNQGFPSCFCPLYQRLASNTSTSSLDSPAFSSALGMASACVWQGRGSSM